MTKIEVREKVYYFVREKQRKIPTVCNLILLDQWGGMDILEDIFSKKEINPERMSVIQKSDPDKDFIFGGLFDNVADFLEQNMSKEEMNAVWDKAVAYPQIKGYGTGRAEEGIANLVIAYALAKAPETLTRMRPVYTH